MSTEAEGRGVTPTGNSIDVTWRVPPLTTGGSIDLDTLTVSTGSEDDDA